MGKVYIVGAGPGDPELLTVKAWRVIQQAEVVVYDRLVSPEILELIRPGAERIYAGKQEGEQHEIQDRILELLLEYGRLSKRVVRLKGGDPMVFGRGAEEWEFLAAHGIETEIVPGISSAVAVPSLAGIPLTFRGVAASFAVVTGHCCGGERSDWARYAAVDTLVILMGVKNRAHIAAQLIAAGREPGTLAAFIENGSTPRERVVTTTLSQVAEGLVEVMAPAVFVVGDVVSIRQRLAPVQPGMLQRRQAQAPIKPLQVFA
jgi:uroporphyrin-III C-methyltransferase